MNRLAKQSIAIVADVAGTTRDTVSQHVDIDGHNVLLVDTAGIEESANEIESQSQHQASRVAREANIRIWCMDGSSDVESDHVDQLRLIASEDRRPSVIDIWVVTKADLRCANFGGSQRSRQPGVPEYSIRCSSLTGQGIDQLRDRIVKALQSHDAEETGSVIGTAARCGQSIRQARAAIKHAIELTQRQEGHEFVSAELRLSADYLGEVTGAVYTDDILDRVFSRFCIGK